VERVGYPHVGAGGAYRTMDQEPLTVDAMRKEGGILVFRRHDDAIALELVEIFGHSQRNSGPVARVSSIDNRIFAQLGNIGDARIFDAPYLLGKMLGICGQRRLRVDLPIVDAVGRARSTEMRKTASVLHAAEQ